MRIHPAAILPLVLVLLSLLSGCASTAGPSEASQKKAAQINARLGANYLRQGSLDLANEKLQKALRQDEDNVDAHATYALLQMELGKPAEARRHFREALSLSPDDPDLHNNYGTFLCNQEDYEAGIKQFLRAAENRLYSTPEYAYANAGVCAVDAGLPREARQYLRQALEIEPRLPAALRELAQLEFRNGRAVEARSYLERYHANVKSTAETLLLAARIERRLGNHNRADEYGRKLLRNFPDSDEAQRFLEER
ncbi:MAG: type IV pilus biogenesis/stability protein PilW [Halofilum sp. (in: g-proteobacteria)]|nr:type IV pilus biogenesis/stability protein PilW [Halofilum sp. (in: g-proteobacteria)]